MCSYFAQRNGHRGTQAPHGAARNDVMQQTSKHEQLETLMGRDTTAEKLKKDEAHQKAGGVTRQGSRYSVSRSGRTRGAQRSKTGAEAKCRQNAKGWSRQSPAGEGRSASSSPPPGGDHGWKTKPLKSGGNDHAHPVQLQQRRFTRAHGDRKGAR